MRLLVASVIVLTACSSSPASEPGSNPGPVGSSDSGAIDDTAVIDDTATGCKDPSPAAPATFEKHTVTKEFLSEGVAVYDVDKDGSMDIVTIPYWYSGPDFVLRHEVFTPAPTLDPTTQYSSVYGVYPQDVDGDGCTDVIVAPREVDVQAYWYRNPRALDGTCGGDAHWDRFEIMNKGMQAGTANPIVAPLFAGKPPVMIMAESNSKTLAWWKPGADATKPWTMHAISVEGFAGAEAGFHGIGIGDVDGDGDMDVLHPKAWFEQTDDPDRWVAHALDASLLNPKDALRTCSRMFAFDIDCDGHADLLCSRPHDYGLFWWRQVDGGAFQPHVIDDTKLSQMHSLRLDDLNGDGLPEIITGKRYYAHPPPGDPGELDPALLLFHSLHRDAAGVHFETHVIDDDSGAGAQFAVSDLDGDGKVDIVVSNKKGISYFLQRAK